MYIFQETKFKLGIKSNSTAKLLNNKTQTKCLFALHFIYFNLLSYRTRIN